MLRYDNYVNVNNCSKYISIFKMIMNCFVLVLKKVYLKLFIVELVIR